MLSFLITKINNKNYHKMYIHRLKYKNYKYFLVFQYLKVTFLHSILCKPCIRSPNYSFPCDFNIGASIFQHLVIKNLTLITSQAYLKFFILWMTKDDKKKNILQMNIMRLNTWIYTWLKSLHLARKQPINKNCCDMLLFFFNKLTLFLEKGYERTLKDYPQPYSKKLWKELRGKK